MTALDRLSRHGMTGYSQPREFRSLEVALVRSKKMYELCGWHLAIASDNCSGILTTPEGDKMPIALGPGFTLADANSQQGD
jgi:hypothetical protein